MNVLARQAVFTPHAVAGRMRRIKTVLSSLLLGLFAVGPWLRWDRGPGQPGQALLIDFPNAKTLVFAIELGPRDLPLALAALIGAGAALFMVSSLAGRAWCGFTCPQTVWTDLFHRIERGVQRRMNGHGEAALHIARALQLVVSVASALTFCGWFFDAPTLPAQLLSGTAPAAAYGLLGVLSFTTMALGAHLRERVCLHMCPWPRFQAAFLDERSLVVTYQAWRGEPRARKRVALRPDLADLADAASQDIGADPGGEDVRGDCIDCHRCVNVCPTGVDIRNGLQMGCIGCGLCMDACDDVMTRIARPTGLIRLDNAFSPNTPRLTPARLDVLRARPLLLAGLALAAFATIPVMLYSRPSVDVTLEAQNESGFVPLVGGAVRNDYELSLTLRTPPGERLALDVTSLPDAQARIAATNAVSFTVVPHQELRERVLVTLPPGAHEFGRTPFTLVLRGAETGRVYAAIPAQFWAPAKP